jgi:hypothetical protein
LDTKGNICVRSGRQVGKSTIVSIKAGDYAVKNRKKTILIISSTERQAYLLFEKVFSYLYDNYPKKIILKGKDRPTKTRIKLFNKSVIYCLPTGPDGHGIRGYTVDLLIADEAAFIGEDVWTAVTPMVATTQGDVILLSTPHGRSGYYYDCFSRPNFTSFHISSENCGRIPKEYLDAEKSVMSKVQYAQEYLGEFIDELRQFFPDHLIKQCMTSERRPAEPTRRYYLGVDVARMGADASTFEIVEKDGDYYNHVENLVTRKTLTTETTNMILHLEKLWNFKQIFIDDGGMGVGVFDQLLTEESTRRKTIAINNTNRPLDREEKKRKRTLKQDLYNNLLMLMERGRIRLLKDDEIFHSLKSMQYEYNEEGKIKIFGNDNHICEGLVRAAWAVKDKSLNIWIA